MVPIIRPKLERLGKCVCVSEGSMKTKMVISSY